MNSEYFEFSKLVHSRTNKNRIRFVLKSRSISNNQIVNKYKMLFQIIRWTNAIADLIGYIQEKKRNSVIKIKFDKLINKI